MADLFDPLIDSAIEKLKGRPMVAGQNVAHMCEPSMMQFVRYEGESNETAIVIGPDKNECQFPAAEIFDPNEVLALCRSTIAHRCLN